jgi:hypothetical protein
MELERRDRAHGRAEINLITANYGFRSKHSFLLARRVFALVIRFSSVLHGLMRESDNHAARPLPIVGERRSSRDSSLRSRMTRGQKTEGTECAGGILNRARNSAL